MTREVFDELDQRLGIVPRWVILRTIQKQSVAEHCFNVERIATQIALLWFGETERVTLISQLALHHDDDEAITGDIPTPAKARLMEEIIDDRDTPWYTLTSDRDKKIVKLADMMEAWWFLAMEYKMGNSYVT